MFFCFYLRDSNQIVIDVTFLWNLHSSLELNLLCCGLRTTSLPDALRINTISRRKMIFLQPYGEIPKVVLSRKAIFHGCPMMKKYKSRTRASVIYTRVCTSILKIDFREEMVRLFISSLSLQIKNIFFNFQF